MGQGVLGKAAAILIALLVLGSLTFGFLAEAVTQLVCGARPAPRSLFSGLWVAVTGDPAAYATPEDCALPVGWIRVADIVAVLVLAGLSAWVLVAVRRYRTSDRAFITDLRTRPGFAPTSEIREHLSAKAVLKRARLLRPDLAHPTATDVGWRVGRSRGIDVYVSIEDSVALEGPPRSGKGYRVLISAIVDWSGPLITTSTTNDNLTATMRMRQSRGTVHVFDPQGLSGIRHPLRIDPIAGCEDPLVAMQRGTAIITGTVLGASTINGEWAQASGVVLGRLLHAAAVGGKTIAELYDWGTSPQLTRTAVDILKANGTPGWGDSLDATISGDEKLVSSIWFGVQGAVAPLAVPQIRDALTPCAGDPVFDPREFLDAANTLYLLGSSSGASAMGGWLGAVLDDIVEVARTTALGNPGSRLTHPLGLILDEIANMFRWGNLPRIMADGGGRGICTFIVLQTLSQAETSWSRAEADTIWAAATAKVLLGGASHVGHLRDIESLLGTRETRREMRSWSTREVGHATSQEHERRPLMSVDEIRRLPPTTGLLAYRNRRSALLDLAGWDERPDARRIKHGKRETEAEQRDVFAQANRAPVPLPHAPTEPADEEVEEGVSES